MGKRYEFCCTGCGYSARVSGRRDVGMHAVVKTMVCSDCQSVVDVLIGFCGKDGPSGYPEEDKDLNKCPECSGTNLKHWNNGGLVPNVGNK